MSRVLYCDGGVIGRNPSKIGGTWAYVFVRDDERIEENSGVITPEQAKMLTVSNNLTEMLAVLKGLAALPLSWYGTIASDSEITLGRLFHGWKMHNVPEWMLEEIKWQQYRHIYWSNCRPLLLQGHPTKTDLIKGTGSKGYPVSKYNVRCDQLCGIQAKEYLIKNTHPLVEE